MPCAAMHSWMVGMFANVWAMPAARASKSESRLLRAVCGEQREADGHGRSEDHQLSEEDLGRELTDPSSHHRGGFSQGKLRIAREQNAQNARERAQKANSAQARHRDARLPSLSVISTERQRGLGTMGEPNPSRTHAATAGADDAARIEIVGLTKRFVTPKGETVHGHPRRDAHGRTRPVLRDRRTDRLRQVDDTGAGLGPRPPSAGSVQVGGHDRRRRHRRRQLTCSRPTRSSRGRPCSTT